MKDKLHKNKYFVGNKKLKNVKMFEEFENTNEDAKYRTKIAKMIKILDDFAGVAMNNDKETNDAMAPIVISIAKDSIEIPFNADSYERLSKFLREEMSDDKNLEIATKHVNDRK